MSNNNNVYEMWKDLYDKSSNLFDEKVKEDFPAQGIGQVLDMNLLFKKMMNESTEHYFDQVNIPTRNDISSISALIVNVDAKVDELEELIEDTKSNGITPAEFQKEISGIKAEMKNLDQKLNSILTLLLVDKEQKAVATEETAVQKEQPAAQKRQASAQKAPAQTK